MSESLRKTSAWLGFSDLNQGGVSHFLGLGGPLNIAAGVTLPMGMFPISSGKGCHLFSLEDCLGVGMGGTAVDGCSSAEGVLGGRMGGGDGGACPNKKVIQGSQSSPKQLWAVAQGGLTGGKDLMMTSAFLPEGLLL